MANEIFNVNGVKKAMEDLQTKFSDFADILAEANGYVETVINVTDDSAVYGNYGTKLQSIWDQNYVTFDNFHKNFESWAEVVSLISANNIDFTVSAESVYRDNAGTLDGIQGARTVIKESGGRNNVDISSVKDNDVSQVLSHMSQYTLDENNKNDIIGGATNKDEVKDSEGNLLYIVETDGESTKITDPDGNLVLLQKNGEYYLPDGTLISQKEAESILDKLKGDSEKEEKEDSNGTQTTTQPFYTIEATNAKDIKKEIEWAGEQIDLEVENLNEYLYDLVISKSALTANKGSYTDEEYAEKLKEYDDNIKYLSDAIKKRTEVKNALAEKTERGFLGLGSSDLSRAGEEETRAIKDEVQEMLSTVPSYQEVVENSGGSYRNLNQFAREQIYEDSNRYSQSMVCSSEEGTNSLASRITLENAYDLAVHNNSTVQQGDAIFFNTSDYLDSAFTEGTEAYEQELYIHGSRELLNLEYFSGCSPCTVGGKDYDSVAYKNPDTGKIEFYSIEEWENLNKSQ